MAVGLSVDYVIHLGTVYQDSVFESRHDKMKEAYKEMGVSILGGTISTLGAGVFMLFGDLVAFYKLGFIIISTVFVAFNISMLFYGAMIHTLGPQNGAGNITCCKKKKVPEIEKIEESETSKKLDIEIIDLQINIEKKNNDNEHIG